MMPKSLFSAILRHSNHYHAVLPFNLNWALRPTEAIRAYLSQHPIRLVDVGARGGLPGELAALEGFLECVCFEADADACARLNASPHRARKFSAFPYFIAERDAPAKFHIYKEPAHSSGYPPGREFVEQFAGNEFGIRHIVEVEGTTLDTALTKENLVAPDILKLDTQGSELCCLRGAARILSEVCLVEVEVEFLPIYEGQPLFHDVMKFMVESGFELLYLNRVFGQRRAYSGPSRGQILFADALFGRSLQALSSFGLSKLIKYALLLVNYGHRDFAFALTQAHPQILQELPEIGRYFPVRTYSRPARAWRFALSQLDKLLCFLLHLRKYNQLPMDSDRGWPFR